MVIVILSYKSGISLHIPSPMNAVYVHYHSYIGHNISFLFSNPFLMLGLHATNAGVRKL